MSRAFARAPRRREIVGVPPGARRSPRGPRQGPPDSRPRRSAPPSSGPQTPARRDAESVAETGRRGIPRRLRPGRRAHPGGQARAWDRGCSRSTSMRPASESASAGTSSTLLEPVSTKRPGRRARSIATLSAANNSGTRCTTRRAPPSPGRSAAKPTGSALAALRAASSVEGEVGVPQPGRSLRRTARRPSGQVQMLRSAHTACASVVLPHWRGPWITTAGESPRASTRRPPT